MNGLRPGLANVTFATAGSWPEEKNVVTLAASCLTHRYLVAHVDAADGRRYLCA